MTSKRTGLASLLASLIVILTACGGAAGNAQNQASGKPITIGVDNDTSGPSSPYSTLGFAAIQVAVDQINQHGGVIDNRPFKIISESDSGQPSQAPTVVQHLIQQGVAAVIMNSGSASSLQVKPLLEQSRTVGLAPLNTNPNIPVPPNNTFAFTASAPQNALDQVLTAAMKKLGVKKPALVIDDTATIAGLVAGTVADYEQAGIPLVDTEKVPSNAADVSAQMARLVSKGADAVFMLTLGGPIDSVILNGLYDANPKILKFSGQQLCGEASNKLAKPEALNGTYCGSQVTLNNPRTKQADTALKAALGSSYQGMGTYYAQGYQGVYTIMKAIQLAGSDSPASIKDGMEKITRLPVYWGGPNFTLSYSPTKHNGSDGNCAYEIDVYKGNTLGGPWKGYQPTCSAS